MSRYCFHFLAVLLWFALPANDCLAQQQYRYETRNFIVLGPDPAFSKRVGNEAEKFRRELAIEWLGNELPNWSEKCPIQVTLAAHAGGETSFAFMYNGQQRGEPTGWDMKIFGTPERLLDSVLPHEVTHTIFATHFRRPLPRWADEGACTTVEHSVEKKKNHGMLIHFLTSQPSRGIPFNRMFTMREYPRDILPLYAQGFSVAKFLIMEKGRRHFLDYVDAGMNLERPGRELSAWNAATKKYYGYESLSDLQVKWEKWVASGSVEKEIPPNSEQYAVAMTRGAASSKPRDGDGSLNPSIVPVSNTEDRQRLAKLNEGWYARQMKVGKRYRLPNEIDGLSQPEDEGKTVWR